MQRILSLIWISLFLAIAPALALAETERYSFTYFEGTQYPLTVVFIQGEEDGPTIMVQGGIQGDEPSGFITAQLLTHAKVRKGNLIIVPRANVPSINLRKRQVNVDMNRRFDQDYNSFYEDRLARVVRYLLTKSDALIHLHEGSGFYNPTYIDNQRNPKRYGQSIIVDTLRYREIDLAGPVDDALAELNPGIRPENWRFQLFNTQTFDENTDYAEMRKSLTCYALITHDIPAVAVEVSKSISQVDWKVQRQLEATLVLLKHYGVDAIGPEVTSEDVAGYVKQVRLRINGLLFSPGQTINIAPGAPFTVEPEGDSEGNFDPALAVFASDRPGVNLLNAPRLALDAFTQLEVRSDGRKVGGAKVRFVGQMPSAPNVGPPVFVCWLNDRAIFVREGETLDTVLGDQLILEGVWGSGRSDILNLKGYVAKPDSNDGQDIGWEIILDPGNFIDKYRLKNEEGTDGHPRYRIVRETPGFRRAEFYVAVKPRTVHALRLRDSQGESLVVPWQPGNTYPLPEGTYVLEDAWSNGPANKLLTTANDLPIRQGSTLTVQAEKPLEFGLRQATTFAPMGMMTFTAGATSTESGLSQRLSSLRKARHAER